MSEEKETMHIGISVEEINVDTGRFGAEPDLESLAILPTRNLVLFPDVTISISLKRPLSEAVAEEAVSAGRPIGIVCQNDPEKESPALMKDLFRIGVLADVIKVLDLPDGEKTAIVKGRGPFRIMGVGRKTGHPKGALVAKIKLLQDEEPQPGDRGFNMIMKKIDKSLRKVLPSINEGIAHMYPSMLGNESPETLVNIMATNLPFDTEQKGLMLSERSVKARAKDLLRLLMVQEQELELSMDIMNQVKADLTEDQKRTFLQRQMDIIHDQLYGGEDDADELERAAQGVQFSPEARAAFNRELSKLRKINPANPDYFVSLNYLQTLAELPWDIKPEANSDFDMARSELDKDHCGLDKVKERVLEHMAVILNNNRGKSPILCLVGPPGVGKTSLGKSIAQALGREYQRVSLGGLHDEAEIRGHRRTYIGAMPGRIIDAVRRAKVANPVLVLDEIDKIGNDYKGDPAAALLEVLDPEQNCRFHDNYIDVDFDLSSVLFIATANSLSTIAKPLLDRMEVISLSGYIAEEKMEIARKHLMRRVFDDIGIEQGAFDISDEALRAIIDTYTSESGVRQLEKHIATIARKHVLSLYSKQDFPAVVKPEHLHTLLGLAPFMKDKYEGNEYAGVACGLAWTEAGGEIILAEASLSKGKGDETVTGNLGQVMKESATIAYQWVKAHAGQLGIAPELFEKYNLYIHFPEGAIPKDGPSAGITIATAIVSAFTQRRVRRQLAMTGEITLRGKVLPVGGIKEKILAAKRAGITDIVISDDNKRDIDDIDPIYVEGLEFHYVSTALEVMSIAITGEMAHNALQL